ncbi:hypothetical protein FHL15_002712 [Xylaria flabelliformis]|uniref:Uncharacterized protein n=1 Tax=Xylaria flabelliformis TaxID=2512241 RepID=A0A553I8B1_9PEZI|nr:hypothetical protein FHL15_002712 [Xylaria flabelliformis]
MSLTCVTERCAASLSKQLPTKPPTPSLARTSLTSPRAVLKAQTAKTGPRIEKKKFDATSAYKGARGTLATSFSARNYASITDRESWHSRRGTVRHGYTG